MAIAAIDRAGARGGTGDTLATLAGALLLLVTIAFAVLMVVEVLARFSMNRTIFGAHVEILETYFGLGFAGVSVLALPAALAAPFVRRGVPPMRSRSALALVPGCWLGLMGVVAGIALYIGGGLDTATALSLGVRNLEATFATYVFPFAPLIIVLSAAIGGAQSPEATVAVAAPAILIWLVGVSAELSITANIALLLIPLLVLAAAFAILFAAAPARAVAPWLVGAVLPIGMILPLAAGLTTRPRSRRSSPRSACSWRSWCALPACANRWFRCCAKPPSRWRRSWPCSRPRDC